LEQTDVVVVVPVGSALTLTSALVEVPVPQVFVAVTL
jgi:hypothetical protein